MRHQFTPEDIEEIWSNVDRSGGPDACWPWQGPAHTGGYGRIYLGHDKILAHRALFTVANGAFPDELSVCHRCDNPACCNPDHLFLGTHADNMRDRDAKGRGKLPPKGSQHHQAKLTEEQVREIIPLIRDGFPDCQIARRFGVTGACIYYIRTGRNWKHVTWEAVVEPCLKPAESPTSIATLEGVWR